MALVYLLGLLMLWLGFRYLMRSQNKPEEEALRFRLILNQLLLKSKYSNLARYWYDLAKMETANFSSNLFLKSNNPWGMKLPEKRQTTAKGATTGATGRDASNWYDWLWTPGIIKAEVNKSREWAKYDTLEEAVKDIILWMDYTAFPTATPSLLTFVQELKKRGYFGGEEVDSYYKKIKAWQSK